MLSLLLSAIIGAQPIEDAAVAGQKLKLAGFFSDGMVLQRDKLVPVWGWAAPGHKVTVSFRGQSVSALVGEDRRWIVYLAPLTAGGPDEMAVFDETQDLLVRNILVGDVWLCSGQSNMVYPVSQVENSSQEIESANFPKIRYVKLPFHAVEEPLKNIGAKWKVCSPETVGSFSAVAYYFGRTLQDDEKVPIGLIDASWGGSSAEAWIPRQALFGARELQPILTRYAYALNNNRQKLLAYREQTKHPAKKFQVDPANKGFERGFHDPKFDDGEWGNIRVPGFWEDQMPQLNIDGSMWFRREVVLSAEELKEDYVLSLGQISDTDNTYWNGTPIGSTGAGEEDPSGLVRKYRVPSRLLKTGSNLLAVRVFNRIGKGGFASNPDDISMVGSSSGKVIRLSGIWKFKIETALSPDKIKPMEIPFGPGHPQAPSQLYNGMIYPILPFAINGFAWYQGETNAPRAQQYKTLLPRLITSWRAAFNQGDLPFLIVQLPKFHTRNDQPTESTWAELREAQTSALKLSKTALAVTIDLGEAETIHPKDKRQVGERLAQAARQAAYGTTAKGLAPTFAWSKVEDHKVRIFFDHTFGSMSGRNQEPIKGFAIAGKDRHFVWAQAKAEGDTVVVWTPKIADPVAVRYAWADNPDCNLVNRAGLPASPFRTDNWPGITDGQY